MSKPDVAVALLAVMDRIHTACLTIECLPPDGPRSMFTLWPAYRHTWWDEGNEESKLSGADITRRLIRAPRFTPTAAQVDDCLPALALLDGVDKLARRVIRLRAYQEWYDADGGWRDIGADCGVSHTTARKIHRESMLYALQRHGACPASVGQALPNRSRRG